MNHYKFRYFPGKFHYVFLVLMIYGGSYSFSYDFEPGGKAEFKIINPDAEVVIGSLLNIRERGSGLFGCGDRKNEGILKANALKWMIDEMNKKLWSGQSANVSLGLYLMDSCDRIRTATSQLVDFLPELQSDRKQNTTFPIKLCVVDDVGLATEIEIQKSLKEIDFPVITMNMNDNSSVNLASTIFLFLQELRWERFAIVHSSTKFSSYLFNHLLKFLKKSDFCISRVINIDDGDQQDLRIFIESGLPIISLLATEEHDYFLASVRNISGIRHRIPILFAESITRRQLKLIPLNSLQIFAVVPHMEKEINFENYHWKNSIGNNVRTEDDLDLVARTNTILKVKVISDKLTGILRNAIEIVCGKNERICGNLSERKGRHVISEVFAKTDWTPSDHRYQLVEYKFQSLDNHIHLHKIMAENEYKHLEVFENNLSVPEMDCDDDNSLNPECKCLEIQDDRTEFARTLEDRRNKKQIPNHVTLLPSEKDSDSSFSQNENVLKFFNKPMVFATLNDPLNGTLACLSLLGGLITLVIAQYFATFAAMPNGSFTSGSSVIGYIILMGLFFLYAGNLAFLLTPLISTCIIRRFAVNVSYAVIFSGMLIKVQLFLQEATSNDTKNDKLWKLPAYSATYTLIQVLISALWLLLEPPMTKFKEYKWTCSSFDDLDPHLILSMIYPFLLLIATIILSIRTCSKNNNNEARWILISSSLVAIIFSCWAVAIGTGVWQTHRTPCTNLAAATILLLCLYVPKIKMHLKLKKSLNIPKNNSPLPVNANKEQPVYTSTQLPPLPVVFGYNMMAPTPVISGEIIDSNYLSQTCSTEESSETASTPFDSFSYSENEQDPYTFSTFLDTPQALNFRKEEVLNDPTQVIPSALYPIDMFNIEPTAITSDHCQPGTNEFTPPHRATSQLYLCPQTEWVP